MASFSVPCPKVSPISTPSLDSIQTRYRVALFPRSESRSNATSKMAQLQLGCSQSQSNVFKLCAQLNEVSVENISNSTPALETTPIIKSDKEYKVPDQSSFSTFMTQVTDLIKLVDSREIVELQLKQMDCEVVIRKKEALPLPSVAAPVMFASPPSYQTMMPPQTPPAGVPAPAPAAAPAPPAPVKPKSSHPPFKCPMAGNFYRSPGPGAPAFVKVGDKVQKGQVICIIEAMKLMNEIEADQSGTVIEILADDGKPVSVDTPLFIIEP